jgi:glycosyltransferase involved in cell wall biosynthesis
MVHLNQNIKKLIILVVLLFLSLHIYWFFSSVINLGELILENPSITLIIASKGRPTLTRTLHSLISQTDPVWKAIVVNDGTKPSDEILKYAQDPRISFTTIPKTGTKNHGAVIRNAGIQNATTDWVGFVDDDDSLSVGYVHLFKDEIIKNPKLDLVIFRMIYDNGNVLPPWGVTNFTVNRVGISFAYKKKLFDQGLTFIPDEREDFYLLDKIRSGGHNYMISKHILYYVRQ